LRRSQKLIETLLPSDGTNGEVFFTNMDKKGNKNG